jgi:hypothetical protein
MLSQCWQHNSLQLVLEDIGGWFDLLDVDDSVTLGGKA